MSTHNNNNGLQNCLEYAPHILHVLSLSIHSFFSHSIVCMTSYGCSTNTLFVCCLACSDFLLHLSAYSSSLHYIAGQWLCHPHQIHPLLQNAWMRLLISFHYA